jgi:hypothetical protein
MKGISRATLRALVPSHEDSMDPRPAMAAAAMAVPGELLDTLKQVFAGTGVEEDDHQIKAILDCRRSVVGSWENIGKEYLIIGRSLNRLDADLKTTEAKARLKGNFNRIFPFSNATASKLRRIAEMVDSGRAKMENLPGSYTAAYQLSLLNESEFEAAEKAGLVQPAVTNEAVLSFRKKLLDLERPETGTITRSAVLKTNKAQLMERRRKLLEEMMQVRRELRALASLMPTDDTV